MTADTPDCCAACFAYRSRKANPLVGAAGRCLRDPTPVIVEGDHWCASFKRAGAPAAPAKAKG